MPHSATDTLAPYASHPEASRGRLVPEPESPTRSVFQRDRDRIIHSGAFRKLQYKTQVFVYHEGDYFRTRLTHSLEVAQIARSISRTLALNEDLAEAVALAHDLGHTCFGHAGEDALREAMRPYGGFAHNDQTLRILTKLEHRYAAFDGLNLTWETLEGVVKHNGPLLPLASGATLPTTLAELEQEGEINLALNTYPGAEAQVAALSDDIAYNNHDIDDGLRAGLFTFEDLAEVPLVGPILQEAQARHPGLDHSRLIHETIRRLIDAMVTDVVTETKHRLSILNPKGPDDIRRAREPMVAFSAAMHTHERGLRAFLMERVYRHYKVNRMTSKARRMVADLFMLLMTEPECLPTEWQAALAQGDSSPRRQARLVTDYIAGMTDRFAMAEHRRLFDLAAAGS